MSKRIAHEVDVTSEGVVNAYVAKKPETGGPALGKRPKGQPSNANTRFFTRVIPGTGCFKPQALCKMQACQNLSRGKKCKSGEVVQVCETKMIPVRCKDLDVDRERSREQDQ